MGIFKKKTDTKTLEYLEKTESAELIISSTVALVNGPLPLYSDLPEGIGTLVLNNDGSGFLWKMISMQGIPNNDEIEFSAIDSWGDLAKDPKFNFMSTLPPYYGDENESVKERIFFNAGMWSFAVSEDPRILGNIESVSEWIRHHYPRVKFNSLRATRSGKKTKEL